MSDQRSAAEILYGRAAWEAPDPSFAISDDGHAEQGMPILLEGIRKAIDAGRSRGDGPIADSVWRRQATEAGGILAYLGKENAAAFHAFAAALSQPLTRNRPSVLQRNNSILPNQSRREARQLLLIGLRHRQAYILPELPKI